MKNVRLVATIAAILWPLLVFFNNCGQVQFQDAAGQAKVQSAASGLSQNETVAPVAQQEEEAPGDDLSPEQSEEMSSNLPPEELSGEPRPVSDLDQDVSLYETYKCPYGHGVVICHFPGNVEGYHTQCVGRNGVKSHFDHIRQYTMGEELKVIGDYLGPCRIDL